MFASGNGHMKVVRFLVEHGGANVNAANAAGLTSLMLASAKGHTEILHVLLQLGGAAVDAASPLRGTTALMLACMSGHLDNVRLLLQHGADRQLLCHTGHSAHDFARAHPLVQAELSL